jgi:hypothetical protein
MTDQPSDTAAQESFNGEAELKAQLPAKYHHLLDPDWKAGRNASEEEIAFHHTILQRRELAEKLTKASDRLKSLRTESSDARKAQTKTLFTLLRHDYEETGRAAMAIGLDAESLQSAYGLQVRGADVVETLQIGVAAKRAGLTEAAIASIVEAGIDAESLAALLDQIRIRAIPIKALIKQLTTTAATGAVRREPHSLTDAQDRARPQS